MSALRTLGHGYDSNFLQANEQLSKFTKSRVTNIFVQYEHCLTAAIHSCLSCNFHSTISSHDKQQAREDGFTFHRMRSC